MRRLGQAAAKIIRSQGPPLRVRSAISACAVAISRTITVAAGVFASGHLGELTRIAPFEMADAVLEEFGAPRERRVRLLPSRAGLGLAVPSLGLQIPDPA